MPDLRIEYRDGTTAYAEVVTDFDREYAQMSSELRKQGGDVLPLRDPAPQLERVWWLTADATCHVSCLRQRAPVLLTRLTAKGRTFEFAGRLDPVVDAGVPEVAELAALGVVDVASRPVREGEIGELRILPAGVEGPLEPDWAAFRVWLTDRLWSTRWADVRRKLGASAAAERHVFIGLTMSSPGAAYFALDRDHGEQLPPDPPELPTEVTHAWVMPAQGSGRCLVCAPDRGWLDAERNWVTD